MSADTSSSIYLRFAGVSFAAIFVIAAIVAFLGIRLIGSSAEQSAARSASDIAGRPLAAALTGAPSGETLPATVRERLDTVAIPLLSASLPGLRVWGPSGGLVYTAGDQSSLVEAAGANGERPVPPGREQRRRRNLRDLYGRGSLHDRD